MAGLPHGLFPFAFSRRPLWNLVANNVQPAEGGAGEVGSEARTCDLRLRALHT